MTRIDFYTNADSRLHVACKLTEKALSRQLRVMLFAPDASTAQALDKLLWTHKATGFVPHCFADAKLAAVTPVLIARASIENGPDDLLINLGNDCPSSFGRYRRLMEIVESSQEAKDAARVRWRHYKERGYEINHVDLARAGP